MPTNRRAFLKASALATGTSSFGNNAMSSIAAAQGQIDQDSFKARLLECLGGEWPDPCDLDPRVIREEQKDGYRLLWVDYAVETADRVPAILLIPDGVNASSPAPGITIWHQHAGQWHLGKTEPAGLAGDPMHHTGVALVKLGYVVLCPDALCFEERQDPSGKLKAGNYERFEFLRYVVDGRCMAWKNILDMRRAVDFLAARDEVDAQRLGCYGHSMGSTHTWLVGPWEPRLKCLVGNCCLPTYASIHRTRLLHCFPNFIPGIHQYGDTPDIAALIAPRALHLNLGETDGGSPIEEARAGCKRIADAYAAVGAADRFTYFIEPDTGHVLSDAMWERTQKTFARHLT
ncbi:MAG: dienelactone hydrolase family protein [Planctomycetaceae bacterium]|nr:dienelactone hydrolase family protein [Planctomycetaceae bacterium]